MSESTLRQRSQGRAAETASTPLDAALRSIRPALWLTFFFSLFINLLRLTIPLYMLQVIDRVLSSGNMDTLLYLTLIAVFALIAAGVITAVTRVIQSRVGSWLEAKLLEPVLGASLDGKLSNRSMGAQSLRDLLQLRNFLGSQSLTTLFDVPWTSIFLFVLFLLHPISGMVATAFAVILLALAILNDLVTRKAQERAGQDSSKLAESVTRAVNQADVIHSMGMLRSFLASARTLDDQSRRANEVVTERSGIMTSIIRTLRQGAQISILGTGAYLVLEGEATAGVMIAGSILMNLALSPIDQAVSAWRGVVTFRELLSRLRRQLSVRDEKTMQGRETFKAPRGYLTIERAMHLPQGRNRPIIKPLSFAISPGEMVGIIGPAAAGKSVLCRMLVGLVPPQSGIVQLDGVNVHEWLAAGLGRHVGYLSQDAAFLPGTIADNIGRLEPDTPERSAAVRQVAEMMDLHGTILNLPQGYETDLDRVSMFMSRSELQKLALARALYREPQLVVLDEPAAFLDRGGENALAQALEGLKMQGKTIALVNQRPALMRLCDRLVLLRDGMMEACGEPEDVLEKLRTAPQVGKDGRRLLHVAHG